MARMGRQNFIDRWVDNKSYQYFYKNINGS